MINHILTYYKKAKIYKYCNFVSDDQILLTIININKFIHKYWPIKLYFVIGISIKTLFYFFWNFDKLLVMED